MNKPKYIFVTGGVTSSLGKGIVSASLARLLQAQGLNVSIQKLDPYINVDAGTVKIEVPNEYAKVCEDFIELEVVLSLRATITSGLFEGVKTTIEYPHTFSQEEIDNALCLD